jgi:ABC-type Fe3+/spermidine/putrescine transport system ATPase subunit
VTHDQEEALILSDRVVVMCKGSIVQDGTPFEIYETPKDSFVASFLGQENFIRGTVACQDNHVLQVVTESGLSLSAAPNPALPQNAQALLVVKKERIKISPMPFGDGTIQGSTQLNIVPAKVEFVSYLGTSINYFCTVRGQHLLVSVPNECGQPTFQGNSEVLLSWEPKDCISIAAYKE